MRREEKTRRCSSPRPTRWFPAVLGAATPSPFAKRAPSNPRRGRGRTRFLSSLAVDGRVAASTQNQALSALLFLYRDTLELDLPWLDGVVRAKRPERLPVVLTREEVTAVLRPLTGVPG